LSFISFLLCSLSRECIPICKCSIWTKCVSQHLKAQLWEYDNPSTNPALSPHDEHIRNYPPLSLHHTTSGWTKQEARAQSFGSGALHVKIVRLLRMQLPSAIQYSIQPLITTFEGHKSVFV
jgi:hypothetical protein